MADYLTEVFPVRKTITLTALLLLLMIIVFSCAINDDGEPLAEEGDQDLPPQVEDWLNRSLEMFLGQAYAIDDHLYILVTYGLKPTGGYTVEIGPIVMDQERITVTAEFTEPAAGAPVTEAMTYPYDLVVIEDPNLPVVFVAEGAETYLPTLYGLDYLPPIVAGSEGIKIFNPSPAAIITETITVEGIANVFEGNVLYRLTEQNGSTLSEGYTTGMMGDWGYFSFEIDIIDAGKEKPKLLLEFYTVSPKDGSISDLVQVELKTLKE
jgi:hypothetical protein